MMMIFHFYLSLVGLQNAEDSNVTTPSPTEVPSRRPITTEKNEPTTETSDEEITTTQAHGLTSEKGNLQT